MVIWGQWPKIKAVLLTKLTDVSANKKIYQTYLKILLFCVTFKKLHLPLPACPVSRYLVPGLSRMCQVNSNFPVVRISIGPLLFFPCMSIKLPMLSFSTLYLRKSKGKRDGSLYFWIYFREFIPWRLFPGLIFPGGYSPEVIPGRIFL